MRYCVATIKALAISLATSLISGSPSVSEDDNHPALRHRRTNIMAFDHVQEHPCILTKVGVQFEDNTTQEYWECQLQGTDVERAGTEFVMVEGLDDISLDFQAVSGVTTLLADGAIIADGAIKVPRGAAISLGKAERPRDLERRLAPGVDERVVLVLRVKAPDAVVSATVDELRTDIFGVGDTDGVNLVERINSCSYGKMRITPFSGVINGVNINTGVLEVDISKAVTGTDRNTIKTAALDAASAKLKISLSSVFDHVMVCLPPGTATSWIGYAYQYNYVSVFNNDWCRSPSSNVHELSHNFGLHHSGEGGSSYGDKTGFMGTSYFIRNGPKMCFNPPKSVELGWYSDKTKTLSFSQGPYQGNLVGVADYNTPGAPTGSQVHLKIPGSPENLYVGFNRATGINAETQEAPDQVTVQGQSGNGNPSWLYAKLSAGQVFQVTNWNGGNKDLVIRVESIDLSTTPATARVTIGYLSGCTPGVCGGDCLPCTQPAPTAPAPTAPAPTAPAPTAPAPTAPAPTAPAPTAPAPTAPAPTAPAPTAPAPTAPAPTAPAPPPADPLAPPTDPEPLGGKQNVFDEGFENGFVYLTVRPGNKDAKINKKFGFGGSKASLEIKGQKPDSQMWTKEPVDVVNYSQVIVDFWFSSKGPKPGDKFFVEASYDGAAYVVVQTFTCGTDWPVGSTAWQNGVVVSQTYGAQKMNIRIRSVVDKNAKVNFDNVRVDKQ